MSAGVGEPRARRLVEARLGRPPQDALEAAVVLEAWAGVPAQRALETARALMPVTPAAALESVAAPVALARPRGLLREGVAFLVTVVAIALWAAPLADALGVAVVERALRLALPVTIGLQWGLQARHLGRPSGLAGLAGRGAELVGAAVAAVFVPAIVFGQAGLVAGLLIVTWTCGTLLIRRGWAAGYCLLVVAAVPLLLVGAPVLAVIGAVAGVTVVWTAWALSSVGVGAGAGGAAVTPGRWSRTLGAGLVGAGVGLLLVGDPTVEWTGGAGAALALLPSAAGAAWAGQHLWKLAGAFPLALTGVPACGGAEDASRSATPRAATWRGAATSRRAPATDAAAVPRDATWRHAARRGDPLADTGAPRDTTWRAEPATDAAVAPRGATSRREAASDSPLATLAVALARFVALTAGASAVLVVVAPASGRAGLLAGFGVVALATLLVGLLESLGRPSFAALGVAAGLAAEGLVRLGGTPFPGGALLTGGACAFAVVAPAAAVLLARPARTLATTLWIT